MFYEGGGGRLLGALEYSLCVTFFVGNPPGMSRRIRPALAGADGVGTTQPGVQRSRHYRGTLPPPR